MSRTRLIWGWGLNPSLDWFTPVLVVSPVLGVVQGDVGHLVAFDPLQEVRHGFLLVTACIVRTAQLHLLWDVNKAVKGL